MSWLFPSLRSYRRDWLRGDLLAGLTVWAVLVPEALAYASIAGVSPVVGLYAAPGALILYAALGSSRQLIAGPMSATAPLSAATVAALVPVGSDRFTAMTATPRRFPSSTSLPHECSPRSPTLSTAKAWIYCLPAALARSAMCCEVLSMTLTSPTSIPPCRQRSIRFSAVPSLI